MRPVALLTDFGLSDHYVGVVHAVLEKHAPGVPRIDLDHLVPPGDIMEASFQLRCAWPHLPAGCVVLAVSTDVERYLPLVILIGCLNVFLGAVMVIIDVWAAMPGWWLVGEGPPIIFIGGLMLVLASRIQSAEID